MDVKIEYKLATRKQISQTFLRFFEQRFVPASGIKRPVFQAANGGELGSLRTVQEEEEDDRPPPTDEEIIELAEQFGQRVPDNMFALAQVQGYLLTKKLDARKALADCDQWIEEQQAEKRRLQELKEKRKRKKKERMERAREMQKAMMEQDKKEKEKDGDGSVAADDVVRPLDNVDDGKRTPERPLSPISPPEMVGS